MKMLIALALPLLITWITTGTDVRDSLTLRVFNKDLSLSDAEIQKLLKKAHLERHGYVKEVTTAVKRTTGSTPDYTTTYYYYKIVPCDKVMVVEKELDKLLKGFLGLRVGQKVKKDVKDRSIMSGKTCKAGVEIHYKRQQNCGKTSGNRVKRSDCVICNGTCIVINMLN